jgi:hypothetical protein
MIHLFETIFDCHFRDETFWFQIVGLFFLVYFFILSFVALYKEFIIESKQQGTFPAIGFVYMLLSRLYIFLLIMNLDDIANIVSQKFIDLYSQKNGGTHLEDFVLSAKQIEEVTYYSNQIQNVLIVILTAFAINFSKAFFSLNSLEFGTLNGNHLKSIFNVKRVRSILEVLLRIIIAFIFIAIEKELSFTDYNADKFKYIPFFQHISIQMGILYGLMLLWLAVIITITYKNKAFNSWNILNGVQFLLGIMLAYFFYKYSQMDISNLSDWNRDNSSWSIMAKFCAYTLIALIFISEFFRWSQLLRKK